jgi:hypothetical protein
MSNYSKRQKAEGRRQKVYYWEVIVSTVKSVLTFMGTAIPLAEMQNARNACQW